MLRSVCAGTQAALAANAAAVERAKAADQAWHTAGEEALRATKALHEARAQAEKLEAARVEEVDSTGRPAAWTELERLVEEQRQVLVAVNASKVARQHADMEAELATREYRRFGCEVAALVDRQESCSRATIIYGRQASTKSFAAHAASCSALGLSRSRWGPDG